MTIKCKVQDLIQGDIVDLENDPYGHEESVSEFEMYAVENVEMETRETVLVNFENHSVGFPTDHKVRREQRTSAMHEQGRPVQNLRATLAHLSIAQETRSPTAIEAATEIVSTMVDEYDAEDTDPDEIMCGDQAVQVVTHMMDRIEELEREFGVDASTMLHDARQRRLHAVMAEEVRSS